MYVEMGCLAIALVSFTVIFISIIWQICRILFWRPYVVTKCFRKQGIRGPPYSLLSGSLHEIERLKNAARGRVLETSSNDIIQRVVPHYHRWSLDYGDTFLYWFGTQPRICISDPELAKHILSNKFGCFIKPMTRPLLAKMAGRGLGLVNGADWVKHRRITSPAFTSGKLKVMMKRMAECTLSMLREWKNQSFVAHNQCKMIEVNGEFRKLTADIIAQTAFGTSYVQGREVFEAQRELRQCCTASIADILIPWSLYLPTPENLGIWKTERRLNKALRSLIESRLNSQVSRSSDSVHGDDLLGLMMGESEAAKTKPGLKLSMNEIIEECKMFFFAGQDTTSNLLSWTTFLLSSHQEWQDRLRQEVLKECGMGIPDSDMLAKLKLVNMVLLEVLRLYSPVITTFRKASKDIKFGDLIIPRDTCISIPVVKIHRMEKYWGQDANEFNPLRFSNGVSEAAKHPNALIGFGMGPRACIGKKFAMLEAKIVIVLMLQRFSFFLSPDYKHTPMENLTLQPQCGLPILMEPLLL
ncbi:hypothetical protein PVL29_008830 [Vitis rotundifolia]|uniref:Cytochrome P450 709B2 n=1 Tax=Vitis rotundifolia TaxID=103349 RepID=A0AA39DVA0_VITRO|nr:hypothetical protein PVL29_008830 [Vitis rotundifolia]